MQMQRILIVFMILGLTACGSDDNPTPASSDVGDLGTTDLGMADTGGFDTGSGDMGADASDMSDAGFIEDAGDMGVAEDSGIDMAVEPICPGPDCDCTVIPLPEGCPLPASQLDVSKSSVLTSEAPTHDTFDVFLKSAPTKEVIVWVQSSDADEAVAFPVKLVFCPPGFTELYGRCDTVAAAEAVLGPITEISWSRHVPIEVNGVRDNVDDGDIAYEFTFYVVSDDPIFANSPSPKVTGTNTDIPNTSSVSRFDGLQDEALLQAIFADESGQRELGYSGTNSARTMMFSAVDLDDQGKVECIYTGITIDAPRESGGAIVLGFNTEHSWPQSQFDQQEPIRGDLHHLFPSEVNANSARSNYDFGMVASTSPTNPLSLVGSNAASATVYQVRPERRGDIARAHFYLAARYRFDTTVMNGFDDDTNALNGSVNAEEEAVLRQWNLDDPVDDLERQRNNRIEGFQHNRNPFVDWPQLVGRIADF